MSTLTFLAFGKRIEVMEQKYIGEHKADCKMFWKIYYYFEIAHKKLSIVYKHQKYNVINGKNKTHHIIIFFTCYLINQ